MEIYRIVRVEGGLLFIQSDRYGRQVWTECRVNKARGRRLCQFCEEPVSAGEQCYRPVTNASNRMDRVHRKCAEFEIKSAGGRHQMFPDIYPAIEIT